MSGPDRTKRRSFAARVSLTAYRWLLYAYPRRFRTWFGAAMTEDCEALLQDSRGLLRAWRLLLGDFAVSVPREWWRAWISKGTKPIGPMGSAIRAITHSRRETCSADYPEVSANLRRILAEQLEADR